MMGKRYVVRILCRHWCVVDTRPDDPEFCRELKDGTPLFFPKIVWSMMCGPRDKKKDALKKAREMNRNDENRKSP